MRVEITADIRRGDCTDGEYAQVLPHIERRQRELQKSIYDGAIPIPEDRELVDTFYVARINAVAPVGAVPMGAKPNCEANGSLAGWATQDRFFPLVQAIEVVVYWRCHKRQSL